MNRLSLFLLSAILSCFSVSLIAQGNAHINWMTFEQMQEAQKKQPRKVIIDMYTDWCGWCKRMDKNTFEHPVIAKYMNDNFYAIKFNAESKAPVMYQGKKYENPNRYHDLAVMLMKGKAGFPTSVYLDEQLNFITEPIASYLDPKQFEMIINYLATEGYKKMPYDQFQKTFKGNVQE